ncbi:5587_t:CDS:2 [Entrophospora sp. SA101]|nr:5587_t:CDS:2 [Entrophospora sp. SA101]
MNSVSAGTVDEWRSRTIYQLLTDRFAQSPGQENPSLCSNNFNETEIRHYCGGTFNGIVNKLDYLKNLGFDAIWISPVVKQVEAETKYGVVQSECNIIIVTINLRNIVDSLITWMYYLETATKKCLNEARKRNWQARKKKILPMDLVGSIADRGATLVSARERM